VLRQRGDFDEAEEVLRQAVDWYQGSANRDEAAYAASLNNLSKVLLHAGKAVEAVPIARMALDACYRANMGVSITASLMNNLGDALLASNCLREAESFMQKAFALRKESLGDQHPQTAVSMTSLARLCFLEKRNNESEEYLTTAIPILKHCYGSKHFRVADALQIKAEIFAATSRENDACSIFREVLAIRKEVQSPDHPDMLHTQKCISKITNNH